MSEIESYKTMTRGIARGSESFFNQFYDAYYDRLYRYVFVMSHYDKDLVKVVMQDRRMRVVRYIKPLNSEKELWQWLRRIARTAYIDEYRRTQKSKGLVEYQADKHMIEIEEDETQRTRRSDLKGDALHSCIE